ncbi:ribbon-helix-helix protein, CopG family [Nocardia concava]|uniref:ribbon-helix-helix protein, CopG family n=1 Tax=Nocardia concava TaxID=257281 RepID=UPI00031D5945|nr:ribbon-helix-helix protein, CopG family [Nocardia concava]
MAKTKLSITIDDSVAADADAAAQAAGLNRSEYMERAVREANLRAALQHYKTVTVPGLGIDEYAQRIYDLNRKAGL